MVKSADGVIVSGVKDVDDFFEHEWTFLLEYYNRVKDASAKSDKMTRSHKSAADDYNRIGSSFYDLGMLLYAFIISGFYRYMQDIYTHTCVCVCVCNILYGLSW